LENASKDRQSNHELAVELAERWVKQLLDKNWSERLNLIADLYEYLRYSTKEFSDFCEIFPDTIAEIINRLDQPEVSCVEQAHLYANSRDAAHRAAARLWFREHQVQP
jgi:hypothetical protein